MSPVRGSCKDHPYRLFALVHSLVCPPQPNQRIRKDKSYGVMANPPRPPYQECEHRGFELLFPLNPKLALRRLIGWTQRLYASSQSRWITFPVQLLTMMAMSSPSTDAETVKGPRNLGAAPRPGGPSCRCFERSDRIPPSASR